MEKIDRVKLDNSWFYSYETNKYKRALLKVEFNFNYKEVDLTSLKVLGVLLTLSTEKYNSIPVLAKYLESLYGTNVGVEVIVRGETVSLGITASYLAECYTKKGNTQSIIELMSEMVYKPNFEKGFFEKGYYKLVIDRILNSLKVALERKEVYSLSEYASMFKGTPFHELDIIDSKKISGLKQEDLLKVYHQLLEAPVNVYAVGDNNIEEIKSVVEKNFKLNNKGNKNKYTYNIDFKPESRVEKSKKYSQSFLIMLLKHDVFTSDKDYYKMALTSAVLNNKLFKQVREKAGLCYMIHNRYLADYGVFEVLTGIEAKNYNRAMKIINKQLDNLKNGKITKKEYKMAKESVLGSFISQKDSLSYMLNNKLAYYSMYQEFVDIDKSIEIIKDIEIEDIVKVSQKIEYHTHYFLKGVGKND